MNNIISALEIAVIIILPLIVFYKKNKIGAKTYVKNVILIYLIWYLTYAFFHEVSHLAGAWALGLNINDYQLIPKIWEGEFGNAYISTQYNNSIQEFITDVMSYFRDFILLIIGFVILKRFKISSVFLFGLTIVLLILSPLYDVFNNYFAFVLGYLNDFNGMSHYAGNFGAHTIGISITLVGLIVTSWFLFSKKLNKDYFNLNPG